jgi:uncharacterized protein (DUF2249 family)
VITTRIETGSAASAGRGPVTRQDARWGVDDVAELTRLLGRAVRELGQAGYPAEASRLAAGGWSLLHVDRPALAQRLTGVLHYLAQLDDADPRQQSPYPTPETEEPLMTTTADRELDVRSQPPARRHDLIFETYAGLAPGDGFVLVNDHDPKPLYYQFAAEHTGQFDWAYLEQGPQIWRVRIGCTADADQGG